MERVCVLGGGGWGTALAHLCAQKGFDVTIWAREAEVVEAINGHHTNAVFLEGIRLEERLRATIDEKEALKDASLVLLVVPAQYMRAFVLRVRDTLPTDVPLVSCSKGIETESLMLMSEVLTAELPGKYHPHLAYLSGPSFALEVAKGMPANVTVAAASEEVRARVQAALGSKVFRIYTSADVIGVQVGGATKNVIAIASGACEGLGFGLNARASIITRGLAEMTRLAVSKGADPLTMAGHAGVGDLVLTCTGELSRNRGVGLQLGRGRTLSEILGSMKMVAEGVATARAVSTLAKKKGIEMPISEQVSLVLDGKVGAREAAENLMSRPLREEIDYAARS